MNKFRNYSLLLLVLSISACTRPGDTTTVGAATGGILGAGMGAIIGSQSGDVGSGIAIGAVAGSVAGGAVGNALQSHEEMIQRQDEAIERQQRLIASQQSEIQELRKIGQDTITYRDQPVVGSWGKTSGGAISKNKSSLKTVVSNNLIPERNLKTTSIPTEVPKASSRWMERSAVVENNLENNEQTNSQELSQNKIASLRKPNSSSSDCNKASDEVAKAKMQEDISDKLFHYRRALRLCPNNANHHNGLGELYLSLNRKGDAQFEFEEASRLDPGLKIAKSNLQKITKR